MDIQTEKIMPDAIGFLGLGNLGRPIVSNLMAASGVGDRAIPAKDVGLFKTTAEALGVPATVSGLLLSLYE
jgi:3-hydroxyisobutyrate dehydrogenase-like beta-hydroxyacid dehydrogenase